MLIEGQSTHHETDIISHFALVAVGYANITNELIYPKNQLIDLLGKIREHTSGVKG